MGSQHLYPSLGPQKPQVSLHFYLLYITSKAYKAPGTNELITKESILLFMIHPELAYFSCS